MALEASAAEPIVVSGEHRCKAQIFPRPGALIPVIRPFEIGDLFLVQRLHRQATKLDRVFVEVILARRFGRGVRAPAAPFARITTAVRADQSLEHWRKWRWISYPCLPPGGLSHAAFLAFGQGTGTTR